MDVRALLAGLGYEVLEREMGWAECLLLRGDERWIGRGRDRDAALQDAVLKALPSYAAQVLLERALAGEAVAIPKAAAQPRPQEPAVAVAAPAPPPPPAPRAAVIRVMQLRPEPSPERDSMLEALEELRARIDSDRGELALCSPQRQRLVLLAWLARARACNDAAAKDPDVGAAVQPIIKTLRILSETWWPGMISAFRLDARPADTYRDLRGHVQDPPLSWSEVATAAENAVQDLEDEPGRDEHGWADAQQLSPPAPDPERVLEELCSEVERFGPLGPRQPKEGEAPTLEQLVALAQRLRWIRESVEDTEKWGSLAGRLRYWATTGEGELGDARRVLDPAFRPPRTWAGLLRVPDDRRKLEQEVADAIAAMPGTAATDDELVRWLVRVLPLTSTHARRIEAAAFPLKDRVQGVDAAQIPDSDRRVRRRLQKLKSALLELDAPPPVTAEPTAEGAVVEEEEEVAPERAVIPDEVLSRTRGRRALFISNRQDPALRDRLTEIFGFQGLDWTEATTRRIDASVDSISADAYDLVLGATGFLNHKTDDRIRRACARAGIPYFRVNRGRPQAVAMALSRDLGVRA